MCFITKIFIIQVLLYLNCVDALCPHVQQFGNILSGDEDIQTVYDNYVVSAISYNTYDTDCHQFVRQPPSISGTIISHALEKAIERTQRYVQLDKQAAARVDAPKFLRDMDRNNYYFESATQYVHENTCSSKSTTTEYLSTLPLERFDNFKNQNVTKVNCKNGQIQYGSCSIESSYRKIDGACNNFHRPLDGRVGDCMLRLLPPDYKDGISQLRTSIDGSPLPNARLMSTTLLGQDENRPASARFTQLHAFFGEFVIGDNAMSLRHTTGLLNDLKCCDHADQSRMDHPQCAVFFIPPNDVLRQIYQKQKCMEFDRTIPCARCKLGPRMISNSVTAAQDLNSVYGVSTSMLNARRTMVDGGLKSQSINGLELFGIERFNASGRYRCFNGECESSPLDVRNLHLPTGVAWSLLFHRNHNRHARNLVALMPHWNDEKIFQEARKWNIAEYHHCVYNEYLQTLIGAEMTNYFEILPKSLGEFSNYVPNVPLKAIIEFQSTAGRHGHAALTEDISFIEPKSGREFKINFRQSELHESLFYDGFVDGMFLAQMSKPAFETTASIPFKTFLYNVPGRTFGLDLAALDIQRQRDHGIPGYVHYLKYCHNIDAKHWDDLQQFIDFIDIEKLKQIYKYVEDVELYIGGQYERKIVDALVGPTFACIIGIQFHNAKFGDRFFYEHGYQVGSFSIEQLNQIKTKSSLASILCENTDLNQVLRDPLRLASHTNDFVSCSVFDDIDYIL